MTVAAPYGPSTYKEDASGFLPRLKLETFDLVLFLAPHAEKR